jgi:hypothetical protein
MTFGELSRNIDRTLSSWVIKALMGAFITAGCAMFFNMAYWTWQQTLENGKNELRTESKVDAMAQAFTTFQSAQLAQRAIDDSQAASIFSLKTDLTVLQQRLDDHIHGDSKPLDRSRPSRQNDK